MPLDRTALLACSGKRYKDVELDGIGTVRIQSLTEGERNEIELKQFDRSGKRDNSKLKELKANWIVGCVVDEHGAKEFSEADVTSILKMDSRITDALFEAIQSHVGLTQADRRRLLKNSQETEGDASLSV